MNQNHLIQERESQEREQNYWKEKLGQNVNVSFFVEDKNKIFHYKGRIKEISQTGIVLEVNGLTIPVLFEEINYFLPAEQFQNKTGVRQE